MQVEIKLKNGKTETFNCYYFKYYENGLKINGVLFKFEEVEHVIIRERKVS